MTKETFLQWAKFEAHVIDFTSPYYTKETLEGIATFDAKASDIMRQVQDQYATFNETRNSLHQHFRDRLDKK